MGQRAIAGTRTLMIRTQAYGGNLHGIAVFSNLHLGTALNLWRKMHTGVLPSIDVFCMRGAERPAPLGSLKFLDAVCCLHATTEE